MKPASVCRWNRFGALFVAAAVFAGCAGLPKTDGRPASRGLSERQGTKLSRAIQPFVSSHPRQSGLHALATGSGALAARLALAGLAERSLDLQYYIWHSDQSGKRLIHELLQAADRGVRVRVLLDDVGASPRDENLLALDHHPNIEVRLFNPVVIRSARLLGAALDFSRVNRRMHNKALIADNAVAIVGGRNIGDEYFGVHGEVNFADLDLAAVGPVVREVSHSFDLYWNSPSAIAITALTRQHSTPERATTLRASLTTGKDLHPLPENTFATRLRRGLVPFLPGRAWALYDDPSKVTAATDDTTTHLAPQLRSIVGKSKCELVIVSPYFIPGKRGVANLTELRRRGVRVIVLTNSLASTDVAAVHAGYRRYRVPLLRAGVELYENKTTGGWGRIREGQHGGPGGVFGSKRASLHAKTFTFDRRSIFVGSMNLDPRSLRLNTENGVLVDCPPLASALAKEVRSNLGRNAYRVQLDGHRLFWTTERDGKRIRLGSEPEASLWLRAKVNLLSWLPIEGQL